MTQPPRRVATAAVTAALCAAAAAMPDAQRGLETPADAACTPEQRREALRAMQAEVLQSAPLELRSMQKALDAGGPLEGWRLSHGYVVLATAGAVAAYNLQPIPPRPPVLLYEPARTSTPDQWRDLDGPDDPYQLVGWAYLTPFTPSSKPPNRPCIAADEWVVHEAGWHLNDGGMQLTPEAVEEPPRPAGLGIYMWHPRVWDLHVWRGGDGVPTIAFANPNERRGGKQLPREAFFYVKDGQKRYPLPAEKRPNEKR